MNSSKDNIYQQALGEVGRFSFDEKVAAVFPDMIERSVPGYSTIITMTGVLAGRFAQENSRCYDLGCSLGASCLSMAQHCADKAITIIGVDNSAAMLERCRKNLAPYKNIELHCQNIQNTDIQQASVVVLNFTLQFVAPQQRLGLLQHIYQQLLPGGILILSEKICFEDPALDRLNIDLHHEFKKANGYSDLEISQKRTALENVLIPETLALHQQRLQQAGFEHSAVWFQCFNFASMVAIKGKS